MAEQRYTIQEQLGAGGNGAVFRAYDTQLKRRVAIKRLLSAAEASSNDPNAEELRREADTLASLRNANIVTIFDVAQDDEGLFMVMEMLEGPDLSDAIAHGPLMFEDFKQLAEQTLEALLAAHNLRILHRDIKPENIKVERLAGGRLQAKIIDFGLARTGIAARKQTEDQEGSVMGSIYYMAPEQLSREPTDVRTDLYALGCVFYECLAGRKPFDGKSVNEVIDKHIDHDVNHLGTICPHLPQWLTFWVMRLMSCKPDDRPVNAQQAIEEFRAWEKLPSMPGMMPWMPQGYGYAQPQPYTVPVPMLVYTGQVPVHTTGYYPVAPPPHITSSSVPVQVQPESGSVPVALPVQGPRAPTPKAPSARPAVAPKKGGRLAAIIAVGAIAAVAAFFLTRNHKPSSGPGAAAPSGLQIGAAPEELFPQERTFPIPESARVFHVTAKVAAHGYLADGSPSPKIDQGNIISAWEDLSKLGGNTPLASVGLAANASPERITWNTTDHAIKDGRSALQFRNASGKPIVMQMLNSEKNKGNFPFGAEAIKNPPGMTLAVVLQADDKQLPCRVLSLVSDDGKSSVSLHVTTGRAFEVQIMTPSGVSKINSTGIDATKPSIALFSWDRATTDIKLRTRDQRGITNLVTAKAPAPSAPLYQMEVGSADADKAKPFTGKLAEIVLFSTAQKDDQSALLEKDLREYYFNTAKPGALNPTKNQKLADFPVGEERDIFNGKDLTGWDGNAKYWSVKEASLTVKGDSTKTDNSNCNLTWKDGTVGDFELNLKLRLRGGANTGVFYRAFITGRTGDGPSVSGYQCDIDTGAKQNIGGAYEGGVRGDLGGIGDKVIVKDVADPKKANLQKQANALPDASATVKAFKRDDWNDIRIVAQGNHVQHFINGKQIVDVTDEGHGRQQDGIIGFEWSARNGSTAQFKDIRVKRLK